MEYIAVKVDELTREIKRGNIYQDYLKASMALNEDESLKAQVEDLRARNFKLQNDAAVESIFEETDKLEAEFCELKKDPIVSEYLNAELALCKMLKSIGMEINGAMEIHLPDLWS